MNRRYAALALAIALVVPGAGVAAASASSGALGGSAFVKAGHRDDRNDDSKHGSDHDSTKKQKQKQKRKVVYSGTLTAVDPNGATLTLQVRGGRDKKLRGTAVTLVVPDAARITRNGASVDLSGLQAGDRVTVQARQKDKVITVLRVIARAAKATPAPTTPGDDDSTPEPTPTTPHDSAPTPTPTA
jgi:hypothetical protein